MADQIIEVDFGTNGGDAGIVAKGCAVRGHGCYGGCGSEPGSQHFSGRTEVVATPTGNKVKDRKGNDVDELSYRLITSAPAALVDELRSWIKARAA